MFILFLNHDYTEEDEKDEFKVFFFILFIFFSVIMVQKTEWTILYEYKKQREKDQRMEDPDDFFQNP